MACIEQPYQLKQREYGVWYQAKELGSDVQIAVFPVLAGKSSKLVSPTRQPIDRGTKEALRAMAASRGVLLPEDM